MTRRALAAGFVVAIGALRPAVAFADDTTLCLREEATSAPCPAGASTPEPPRPDEDHVTAARAALATAREQFLASAFREAATTLQLATSSHVEHLLRGARPLAVEMLHWAGACALLAGDRDGARATFQRALAMAPETSLPQSAFNPDVEAFFTELRYATSLLGMHAYTVRATPVGARVEIDGRDEGVSPVTVRLAPGAHFLRVERAGYRTWFGSMAVDPSAAMERNVVLVEATGAELRAQLGRPGGLREPIDGPTLARVAREYQVARVVFLQRDGREVVYPPPRPFPWVWVGVGAAVAAGVGVGLYFALRPPQAFELRW